mmetsp:Transcript_28044/g.82126  ORF Transcript_28044/g.82126 Transcript_28044/m.82126 type:complete len:295 (-) Transcript_28044:1250-2134(-)
MNLSSSDSPSDVNTTVTRSTPSSGRALPPRYVGGWSPPLIHMAVVVGDRGAAAAAWKARGGSPATCSATQVWHPRPLVGEAEVSKCRSQTSDKSSTSMSPWPLLVALAYCPPNRAMVEALTMVAECPHRADGALPLVSGCTHCPRCMESTQRSSRHWARGSASLPVAPPKTTISASWLSAPKSTMRNTAEWACLDGGEWALGVSKAPSQSSTSPSSELGPLAAGAWTWTAMRSAVQKPPAVTPPNSTMRFPQATAEWPYRSRWMLANVGGQRGMILEICCPVRRSTTPTSLVNV